MSKYVVKNGQFAKKANTIISYFKEMINNQVIKNYENYHYGYLKMKKNNKLKTIDLIFQNNVEYSESYYQLIFPLRDDINFLYKKINLNNFDKQIYIDISKELFIKLNNDFFQFFNFDKQDINYDTYNFAIKNLDKNKIDIIVEKIMIEKKLNNF